MKQPHLVGGWATPLKNMSSSIGMIRNPRLMGKYKIDGNQTTNQPHVEDYVPSGIQKWLEFSRSVPRFSHLLSIHRTPPAGDLHLVR